MQILSGIFQLQAPHHSTGLLSPDHGGVRGIKSVHHLALACSLSFPVPTLPHPVSSPTLCLSQTQLLTFPPHNISMSSDMPFPLSRMLFSTWKTPAYALRLLNNLTTSVKPTVITPSRATLSELPNIALHTLN